ncbi:MAG TPA: hypothetical protein VKY65_05300 [Alphaproteobacteria bacterium]|nr:hypothetical protein [Alphaproteobacteria bacterium]
MAGTARLTAIVLTLMAVAACSPQRMSWTKEGLTQDELRRDQKACLAESHDYGFLNLGGMGSNGTGPTGGSSSVAARQEGDLYRACMQSRGYSQVPANQKPPGQPQ